MGKYTPIYYFLYKVLPGFSMNRYPVKYIFMATFISAMLAAFGMELAIAEGLAARMKRIYLVIGSALLLASLLAAYQYNFVVSILMPLFQNEINQGFAQYIPALISKNIVNVVILGLFILAFVFVNSYRKEVNKKLFIVSLLALLAFDLAISNKESVLSIKIGDYHKIPGNISYLQKDPDVFRVFVAPTMAERSQTEVASEFADYGRALYSMRNRIPVNQNMIFKIQLIDAYESIKAAKQDILINKINRLNSLENVRVLDALNVKYVVSPWPLKFNGLQLVRREAELIKQGYIYLYKNNNFLPRAYVAPSAVSIKQSDMLDYMCSKHFDPEKFVLLEGELPNIQYPGNMKSAEIIQYSPNEVEINATGPGFLFLSDSYYPGWRAYVDSNESKIYEANYMFRAVLLPNGDHKIKFVYNPLSFTAGLVISVMAIVSLAVGFILLRQKK